MSTGLVQLRLECKKKENCSLSIVGTGLVGFPDIVVEPGRNPPAV